MTALAWDSCYVICNCYQLSCYGYPVMDILWLSSNCYSVIVALLYGLGGFFLLAFHGIGVLSRISVMDVL
jgi:hypothetical protein